MLTGQGLVLKGVRKYPQLWLKDFRNMISKGWPKYVDRTGLSFERGKEMPSVMVKRF